MSIYHLKESRRLISFVVEGLTACIFSSALIPFAMDGSAYKKRTLQEVVAYLLHANVSLTFFKIFSQSNLLEISFMWLGFMITSSNFLTSLLVSKLTIVANLLVFWCKWFGGYFLASIIYFWFFYVFLSELKIFLPNIFLPLIHNLFGLETYSWCSLGDGKSLVLITTYVGEAIEASLLAVSLFL